MNTELIERIVGQLRDVLAEGEYDTGQIAKAARTAATMMRRGEIEVDWLAEYVDMQTLNLGQI